MDKFTARLRCGSVSAAAVSHAGAREYQEDSYGFSELNPGLERFAAVLADGMGGLPGGALVSSRTVSGMLAEDISTAGADVPEWLRNAAQRTSSGIAADGSGGGSTLVEAVITPEGLYFCSVGDSRIYLRRGNSLTQLTEDHDHLRTLLTQTAAGQLTYQQAVGDKDCGALTQYIGSSAALSPDISLRAFPLLPGDRVMLCSDGVYNALSSAELLQSLTLSAAGAAEDILGRILARNFQNQDNFTAIVLEILPDYVPEPLPQPERPAISVEHSSHTSPGGEPSNEDCVYADGKIFAAADGLGSQGGGARASAAAVGFLAEHRDADFSPAGIEELFSGADSAVRELGGGLASIAAGFVQDGCFTLAGVGNARGFYFRGGEITARTYEASQGAELRSLGSSPAPELRQDCQPIEIRPGDAFLVCTDGFWEHVQETEMTADLLKSHDSREWLERMTRRQIQSAHESGDNYSAVCGIFTSEPEPAKRKRRRWLPAVIAAACAALMILALGAVLMWLSGDREAPDEPAAQSEEMRR